MRRKSFTVVARSLHMTTWCNRQWCPSKKTLTRGWTSVLLFVEPYVKGTGDSKQIHLPKLHPGQRYNQRLALHAVYQWHKKQGHGKRLGASLRMEKSNWAHRYEEVLHRRQIHVLFVLHGRSDNARQWLASCKHHRRHPAGSSTVNCHVFVISDSQFNIIGKAAGMWTVL